VKPRATKKKETMSLFYERRGGKKWFSLVSSVGQEMTTFRNSDFSSPAYWWSEVHVTFIETVFILSVVQGNAKEHWIPQSLWSRARSFQCPSVWNTAELSTLRQQVNLGFTITRVHSLLYVKHCSTVKICLLREESNWS